jgi:hypothetical protein
MLSDPSTKIKVDCQESKLTTNGVETSFNRAEMFRFRLCLSTFN